MSDDCWSLNTKTRFGRRDVSPAAPCNRVRRVISGNRSLWSRLGNRGCHPNQAHKYTEPRPEGADQYTIQNSIRTASCVLRPALAELITPKLALGVVWPGRPNF